VNPIQLTRRNLCLGLLATAANVQAAPHTGQGITIRNAQLKVMKELRTGAEVAEFYKYWNSKQATGQTSAELQDWSFTLDIVSGSSVDRWLYQSTGMATKVDAKVQQVYNIKNPAVFNTLIGAPRY
jgi:hypothetical protein